MVLLVSTGLLALAVLAVVFYYAVAAPGSQWLGQTRVCGDAAGGKIALTFDDGPGEATPLVLDILQEAGIRATFFLCGRNTERFPDYARRIADEGHEIGNHTYSHPRLLWKTPGRIAYEIDRAQNVIAYRTGHRPKLFRPPYGIRWFGLSAILARNDLTAVMWSVNGRDWTPPAERIVDRVLRQARPGSIILLHDGVPPRDSGNRQATVEALRQIIHILGGRYRFVTVSEMVGSVTC